MRRRLVGVLIAVALLIGGHAAMVPLAVHAKPCGSGWKHAVIHGSHKCLRRGQFCSQGSDRQYHRYGFHCHTYKGGGYRLA